jgi:hypothetical protein
VPAGFSTVIKQLVVTNTTGSAATFTFYIGDAVAGNALFSATSVAANDTVIINLSQVLQSNEVLRALASVNSTLNLTVSGVENDGPLEPSANFIANDSVTVNKIADGSVTSAKIADETIVNTDINASAAIAQSKVANLTSDLALKAPIASPTFTGVPLAPTAGVGTNTTQLATTAFANSAGGLVFIGSAPAVGNRPLTVGGVFSSTYLNYRIVLNMYGSNSGDEWFLRFLNASGVEISSSNYTRYGVTQTTTGAVASAYSDSANRLVLGALTANSQQLSSSVIDVFNANTATRTTAHFKTMNIITGQYLDCTMQFTLTDALTGFVIYGLAGNVFGDCKVYGYRN